jgi:hypothetical protein
VKKKEKRNDETETKTENETLKTGKNGAVTLALTSFDLIPLRGHQELTCTQRYKMF